MNYEITCPACKSTLRVQEDAKEPWVTCPRCLARFANPASPLEQGISAAVQTRQPRAVHPADQEAITRQPVTVRRADQEAMSGLAVTYWSILLLTVFCIIGTAVGLHSGPTRDLGGVILAMLALAGLFFILDVLVWIALGKAIFSRLKPAANPVAGVFKVLASICLFLVLAVAVVIFFNAACGVVISAAQR